MGVGLGARVVVVGVRIVVGRGAPGLVGGEPRHCVDVIVELGRLRGCCKVGGSIGGSAVCKFGANLEMHGQWGGRRGWD